MNLDRLHHGCGRPNGSGPTHLLELALHMAALNPPQGAEVSIADFEATIDRAETQLSLQGQPRAVVFHEKHGRRHAHVVWSRINPETMQAVLDCPFKVARQFC